MLSDLTVSNENHEAIEKEPTKENGSNREDDQKEKGDGLNSHSKQNGTSDEKTESPTGTPDGKFHCEHDDAQNDANKCEESEEIKCSDMKEKDEEKSHGAKHMINRASQGQSDEKPAQSLKKSSEMCPFHSMTFDGIIKAQFFPLAFQSGK